MSSAWLALLKHKKPLYSLPNSKINACVSTSPTWGSRHVYQQNFGRKPVPRDCCNAELSRVLGLHWLMHRSGGTCQRVHFFKIIKVLHASFNVADLSRPDYKSGSSEIDPKSSIADTLVSLILKIFMVISHPPGDCHQFMSFRKFTNKKCWVLCSSKSHVYNYK